MNAEHKSLLVRADFALSGPSTERRIFHRWRRILIDALPRLLGCAQRCPRAEHVCLHEGAINGRYTAWLRIPIQRRPSRRRTRLLKTKLRSRLEAGLEPLQGKVLKLGVRRCQSKPAELPLFTNLTNTEIAAVPVSA